MINRPSPRDIGFWGICFVSLMWIAATIIFEAHLEWPDSGSAWVKRLAGWGVEIILIRALFTGVRRCYRPATS